MAFLCNLDALWDGLGEMGDKVKGAHFRLKRLPYPAKFVCFLAVITVIEPAAEGGGDQGPSAEEGGDEGNYSSSVS